MWQIFAISVIVGFVGLLFYGYIRSKTAETDAARKKVAALEKAAADRRAKEKAENVAEAKEALESGDPKRAIGFLRDSFGTDK